MNIFRVPLRCFDINLILLKSSLTAQVTLFRPRAAEQTFLIFPKIDTRVGGVSVRPRCLRLSISSALKACHMLTGTVKFYNHQRGFGFIQPDDGGLDVFVHATALERSGVRDLADGQKVEFETMDDRRSGKIAVNTLREA
jgi:CspA family cold shock protein